MEGTGTIVWKTGYLAKFFQAIDCVSMEFCKKLDRQIYILTLVDSGQQTCSPTPLMPGRKQKT
jgi:hypothetical protein